MEISNWAPVIAVDPATGVARAIPSVRVPVSVKDLHRRFARSLKAMPRMATATTERETERPKPRLAAAREERDSPNNLAVCDHLVLVMCS
jgi:hypothetical protein